MGDKVVSLRDVRRKRMALSGLSYRIPDKPEYRRGLFKGAITQDGAVIVEIQTDKGPVQHEFEPAHARDLERLLGWLAMHGERMQKKLRGDLLWVPTPGPTHGTFLVRHDGRERTFTQCQIGKRKRQPSCESCLRELGEGEAAYREANPKSWEFRSWRDVRLCRACVETPARTGIEEVAGG